MLILNIFFPLSPGQKDTIPYITDTKNIGNLQGFNQYKTEHLECMKLISTELDHWFIRVSTVCTDWQELRGRSSTSPTIESFKLEMPSIEPGTFCVQCRCSTSEPQPLPKWQASYLCLYYESSQLPVSPIPCSGGGKLVSQDSLQKPNLKTVVHIAQVHPLPLSQSALMKPNFEGQVKKFL